MCVCLFSFYSECFAFLHRHYLFSGYFLFYFVCLFIYLLFLFSSLIVFIVWIRWMNKINIELFFFSLYLYLPCSIVYFRFGVFCYFKTETILYHSFNEWFCSPSVPIMVATCCRLWATSMRHVLAFGDGDMAAMCKYTL